MHCATAFAERHCTAIHRYTRSRTGGEVRYSQACPLDRIFFFCKFTHTAVDDSPIPPTPTSFTPSPTCGFLPFKVCVVGPFVLCVLPSPSLVYFGCFIPPDLAHETAVRILLFL